MQWHHRKTSEWMIYTDVYVILISMSSTSLSYDLLTSNHRHDMTRCFCKVPELFVNPVLSSWEGSDHGINNLNLNMLFPREPVNIKSTSFWRFRWEYIYRCVKYHIDRNQSCFVLECLIMHCGLWYLMKILYIHVFIMIIDSFINYTVIA